MPTPKPAQLVGSVAVAADEIDLGESARWNIMLANIGEMPAENALIEVDLPVGTILAPESEALGWSCTEVTAAGEEAVTSCVLDLDTLDPNECKIV